jgi:hypothetical protein
MGFARVACAVVSLALSAQAEAQSCDFIDESGQCVEAKSRWIASVPFGAGQLQNGDDDLGWALLITETVLLGSSIALYVAHEDLRGGHVPSNEAESAVQEEAGLRIGNWVTFGLFAAVAATGIFEAHLTLEDSETSLVLAPGGAVVRYAF